VSTAHDAHEAHDDEHHVDHGSPFIQHHYDDAQHQFDSGKLGIWLFLAQEVLFFSGLFVAYILYRVHHPEIYSYAHKWLDVKMGATNTAVLIFSSLTAAWAVRAAQLNQRKQLIGCIVVTIACACTFLVIKYMEYSHKVHEHILFGRYFDPCISPGGTELLTKHNDCKGTKTTITWSLDQTGELDLLNGKATAGCMETSKFDQDPEELGIQANCKVFEVHRTRTAKGDWQEQSRKEITNRCPEERAERLEKGETGTPEAPKFPCWQPSYQPAVCVPIVTAGKPNSPQFGVLVRYGDEEERGDDVAIEAKCDAAKPAAEPADIFAEHPETARVGQKSIHPEHILTEDEEHELESLGPPPEHCGLFLTIYFAMTGLHGIHVVFGVFIFIWLLIRAVKGQFNSSYFGPIDFAALYWHIVDLIWIFLFPLLYLIH
jgi:cytochrome c oxidase subunit 3